MAGERDRRVVIIGAGPTGLTAALRLGLRGIAVTLLESEPDLTHDLRAGSFHPPTVEMLTELGVGAAMHETALIVPQWQIRDRLDGVVAEFDLTLLADETPFPYRLHLEQHRLTPLLLARIRDAAPSVEVRFSSPVVEVAQDADHVRVRTAAGEEVEGAFLIAGDGARSLVRRTLGIEFEGFTWPERLVVASTTFDLAPFGFTSAGYIADPEMWGAAFRVPDDGPPGLWRIAYPVPAEESDAVALDEALIQQRLRMLLDHAGVAPPGGVFPLKYSSIYKTHQRVAQRFVGGRFILGGDAAHLNNPLGAMGLNGSVHDAMNIADKLIEVLEHGADHDRLLDLYDRQRRPVNIQAVQAMSIRNKKLLEERDPAIRRERLQELRDTVADKAKAKAYLMHSSMINSVRDAAAIT